MDQQVTGEVSNADMVAADSGMKGSGGAKAPEAKTSGGSLSVAGAIGINIASSDASATIQNDLAVTAGGALTLNASNNTDASVEADGSSTQTAGGGGTGVGAAVGINVADAASEASIGTGATISAVGVKLDAGVRDVSGDTQNTFKTKTTAGAGGGKTGIAGSIALNIVGNRSEAVVRSTALSPTSVNANGGDVTLSASNDSATTTDALMSDGGAMGSDLGVGASFALSVVDNTSSAELADSSDLTAQARSVLDEVAAIMEANPGRVEIAGYADSRQTQEYNLWLSERRAESVQRYLVAKGLDAGRFEVVEHGENNPADSNATAEGQQNNRRTEFHALKEN